MQRVFIYGRAIGALPAFLADASAISAEAMTRAVGVWTINFLAEFAFVATHALALAAHAVTVSIAVGHFALIVPQRALFTLPTGITNTFAVNIFAMLRAQHWANALAAVVATKAGIALTMPK